MGVFDIFLKWTVLTLIDHGPAFPRRHGSSREQQSHAWFALTSCALGTDAVEGKDAYTILSLPYNEVGEGEIPITTAARSSYQRRFVCWEYVGGMCSGT